MEFMNKLFNLGNEQGDWEPFFKAIEGKPKIDIQTLCKRFTDTAKWLSSEEVNRLIEFYSTYNHKDSEGCIRYLERMLTENFCIKEEQQ
jgi:hypothetical protein